MGGHWSKEKPLSVTLDLGVMNLKSNLVQLSCNQYRKNEIMPSAATRMGLKTSILSEVNQTERQISYDIIYMQNLKKNDANEVFYKTDSQTSRINLWYHGGGERWGGGID